ncbi:hypothetical protein D3C80_1966970 [compost metagenome]
MALPGAGQAWEGSFLPGVFPGNGLDRVAGCFWACGPGSTVCCGSSLGPLIYRHEEGAFGTVLFTVRKSSGRG